MSLCKPWLDSITEGAGIDDWIECPVCAIEDDGFVLEAVRDDVINEDAESALKKLRGKGWSTSGRSLGRVVKTIDPDFINHDLHKQRLMKGGTRPNGETYPGGGGLRWGGLVVKDGQALLRVMGSLEYPPKDGQQIYQQTLGFSNFMKILKAAGANWSDKGKMLLKDRVKIHCDCPAFRYYHAHAATKKGFALMPELRPSPKTNPDLKGGICKHLDVVLKYLPAQAQRIASEMKSWAEARKKPRPVR
jgi:hypothetical protein